MTGKKLNESLETFLMHLDSIRDTLPMTMLLLEPHSKKANNDFISFVKNEVEEIEDDKGKKKLLVKIDQSKLFESLEKNAYISSLAAKIIPESLFVSLISQYDAFLNRLLRAIFEIKPDILNGSDRNLSFSQLVSMGSIQDAREFIIEKEIDTILRKSHSEQFDYLESKLGIELRKGLPIWSTFIEITERRNLLVHCDGTTSGQYFKVCKEHNCVIGETKPGDRLGVPAKYFSQAYKCLYEITVKLTHTLWRKLIPSDLKQADMAMNDICYDLINNESLELADILLQFAYGQKKHYNDSSKNLLIINGALSKYLQNKKDEAKVILDKKDWSASSDDFKLANAVLTDNFEKAYQIMQRIGKNGDIDQSDYKQWPLFSIIREEEKFKQVFKEIFEEDYKVLETPMRPVQEMITKALKKNRFKNIKVTKTDSSNKTREN